MQNFMIGCGTVVFRKYSLHDALSAIRNIGYEYVETQAIHPWCPHADVDRDDPVRFASLVSEYGFKGITALWMPHGCLLSDDLSTEYAVRSIEWASAAGIGVVNTGDGFKPEGMSDVEALRLLSDRLGRILEAAAKYRVRLAIEPHGTFSLTLRGLRMLMSLSDSPWFGINYDAANIRRASYVESGRDGYAWKHSEGGGDESGVLRGIADRVVHFHAKDIRDGRCTALGEGEVALPECVAVLREAGYRGVLSLETEGEESLEEAAALAERSFRYLRSL